MKKQELGIYIHIPCCVQKCLYCDFLSFSGKEDIIENYVNTLCKTIDALTLEESTAHLLDYSRENYYVKTVYFGGGTPSLIDAGYIKQILCKLKQSFDFHADEITLEANPGTLSFDKLKAYKEMGINRLSMGLQSANDDELRLLGRIHSYQDFENNYYQAREVGFDNISVDIMTALPYQTEDKLRNTLEKIIGLNPEHISAYSLILEEGTAFYSKYEEHPKERELYYLMRQELIRNGYEQYEISNFSKKGYESRHNCSYWRGTPYLGFGLGASSYFGNYRLKNQSNLDDYVNWKLDINNTDDYVNQNCDKNNADDYVSLNCDKNNVDDYVNHNCGNNNMAEYVDQDCDKLYHVEEILTREDMMDEFMILGLRMTKGVTTEEFRDRFNEEMFFVYGNQIRKMLEEKLLKLEDTAAKENKRIFLTEKGIDYGNYVFSQFLRG